MLKLKKLLIGLPIFALVLSVATVTVYAQEGYNYGGQSGSTSPSSPLDDKRSNAGQGVNSNEGRTDDKMHRPDLEKETRSNEDKFRKSGNDMLMRLQAERKEARTAEQRKKSCEARKTGLQRKVDNLNTNAAKHQKRIDDVFDRVVAYQKNKNVVIDNFDALVAAATAAQSKSQASVQALAGLKPSIDCNKDSVASDVATFKAAAAQARTDLSAYKNAVKDILKAAQNAKEQGA